LIAALVLAAGKSERMGHPKALLRFQGKTFLDHILDAVDRSSVRHAVVVVGHHREEIGRALKRPVPIVFNPDYEQGMCTSVQTGLRSLPPDCTAAAILLVDHPLVTPEIIDQLAGHAAPGRIVVPVHQGRRGHPVIIAADLFHEIFALGSGQGLNVVVRRDPSRVVEVEGAGAGVLRDIDTPEEFEKLLHESP
jgi:molybdenum cofactor cytidylyltransferase